MAFSDFTLVDVRDKLGLTVVPGTLFSGASPVTLPTWFTDLLHSNAQLAASMGTEKAKSELLISPLLVQAYNLAPRKPSFFSGVEFNVDAPLGLKGVCDFLFSLSPDPYILGAPVIVLVEAKNESFSGALPQCAAEMYGARLFNENRGQRAEAIYGVISTGLMWTFLQLVDDRVVHDATQYGLRDAPTIVAILLEMLKVPMTRVDPSPRPTTPTPTPTPTDTQHV